MLVCWSKPSGKMKCLGCVHVEESFTTVPISSPSLTGLSDGAVTILTGAYAVNRWVCCVLISVKDSCMV